MRRLPISAWIATGAGLVFSPALIGIPILMHGVGELLGHAHDAPPGPRRTKAGQIAVLVLGLAVVTGVATGVCIVDPLEHLLGDDDPAIAITAVAAPLIAGLLFAPFVLAPSVPLLSERGTALGTGLELAARLGALRVVLLGALLGGAGALPFALAGASALVDDDLVPLALLAGVALDVALAPWILRTVAAAATRAHATAGDHARSLGALSRFSVVPLVLVVSSLALGVAAPSPLRVVGPVVRGSAVPSDPWELDDDLRVQSDWRGVEVWRVGERDRAERHRFGGYPMIDRVEVVRRGEGYVLRFGSEYGPGRELVIDERGRRVDDGLRARFTARTAPRNVALLVLACALGVLFAVRAGRALGRAREIAAIAAGAAGGELVRGVLRVRGAPVLVQGGVVHAGGGAWLEVERGALGIALPGAPHEPLAIDPALTGELPEGTPVVLRVRGVRLGGAHRDARAAWPDGALAVWGDLERAASAHAAAAFPALARLGVAIGALLVVAALAIASSAG